MASPVRYGGIAWRFAVLGGVTAGLALSPALPAGSAEFARPMLALGLAAGIGLIAARPGEPGAPRGAWLALLAIAAAACGLAVGALRLAAIDRGALPRTDRAAGDGAGIRDGGAAPSRRAR